MPMIDFERLVCDFAPIAEISGVRLPVDAIDVEVLSKPHLPSSMLPQGKMAVYVFLWGDLCLKVGKVGPRSKERYTSQHYNPKSSQSNLAKSILNRGVEIGLPRLTEDSVGDWIRAETDRVNFLLDIEWGMPVLSLMESFLQCRLRPHFEGFVSQK